MCELLHMLVLKLKLNVVFDVLLGMWLTSVHRCGGPCSAVPCYCSGIGSEYNRLLYNLLDRLINHFLSCFVSFFFFTTDKFSFLQYFHTDVWMSRRAASM